MWFVYFLKTHFQVTFQPKETFSKIPTPWLFTSWPIQEGASKPKISSNLSLNGLTRLSNCLTLPSGANQTDFRGISMRLTGMCSRHFRWCCFWTTTRTHRTIEFKGLTSRPLWSSWETKYRRCSEPIKPGTTGLSFNILSHDSENSNFNRESCALSWLALLCSTESSKSQDKTREKIFTTFWNEHVAFPSNTVIPVWDASVHRADRYRPKETVAM